MCENENTKSFSLCYSYAKRDSIFKEYSGFARFFDNPELEGGYQINPRRLFCAETWQKTLIIPIIIYWATHVNMF